MLDDDQNITATYKTFGTEYRAGVTSIDIIVQRLMVLENEVKELKEKINQINKIKYNGKT